MTLIECRMARVSLLWADKTAVKSLGVMPKLISDNCDGKGAPPDVVQKLSDDFLATGKVTFVSKNYVKVIGCPPPTRYTGVMYSAQCFMARVVLGLSRHELSDMIGPCSATDSYPLVKNTRIAAYEGAPDVVLSDSVIKPIEDALLSTGRVRFINHDCVQILDEKNGA